MRRIKAWFIPHILDHAFATSLLQGSGEQRLQRLTGCVLHRAQVLADHGGFGAMRHPVPFAIKGKEIFTLVVAHRIQHGCRLLFGNRLTQLATGSLVFVRLHYRQRRLHQVTHLVMAVFQHGLTLVHQRQRTQNTENERDQYHLKLQPAFQGQTCLVLHSITPVQHFYRVRRLETAHLYQAI